MARPYKEITKDVLLGLAVAGAIAIAATSPYFLLNIARGLAKEKKHLKKKYNQYKIAKVVDRLRRSRMVILKEKDGKFTVELTEKGKRKAQEIEFNELKIETSLVWDKIWRIVIFDIPDKKKAAREALRSKLKDFKFHQLQRSVWASPYPCEKEIELLIELFDMYSYVHFIKAKEIKNDLKLRRYFKLI